MKEQSGFSGRDTQASLFAFGPFTLNPAEQTLTRNGIACHIQPQPIRLLAMLVSRSGQLILREELRREIWGENVAVDYEHGLNFAINQIRTVLGDSARAPRYIETVPRAGYRFVAPVRSSEVQPTPDAPVQAIASSTRPRNTVARWALIALALLAALVAIKPSERSAPSPIVEPLRLAVMPFESVGIEPALADGITLDLIASLGQTAPARLTVIGRRSMTQFRGSRLPASEIGRQLNANLVVEGQVTRQQDRLRIYAMLIDAADDGVRWSMTFDRSATELFAVQQEIARLIAEQLRLSVAPGLREGTTPLPLDTSTYRRYAEARWALSAGTAGASQQALIALREVVHQEPGFASGQAALASILAQSAFGTSRDSLEEAFNAANAALVIDPKLSEAHFALGLLQAYGHWDFLAGQRSLARALEFDPSNAHALSAQAGLMAVLGDAQAAALMSDLAVTLDPLSGNAWTDSGFADYLAGRYALARDRCERGVELGSTAPIWSGYCWFNASQALGDAAATDRAISHLAELTGRQKTIPEDLPREERVRRFHEEFRAGLAARNQDQLLDYLIASHEMALGRRQEALSSLEQALLRRDLFLPFAVVDPVFRPLHGEPRFQQILASLHLAPTS